MFRRLPFTLLFLTTMIIANTLAGTLGGALPENALSNWGVSHGGLRQGELFRVVSGTFLSHNLGMFLRQVVFAASIIGTYEWIEGTRRAIAMFVLIDVAGTLLVLFVVLPGLVLFHPTIDSSALAVYDVGMSAGGFGLIGALSASRRHSWLYLLAICLAIFVKVWISFDMIADSAHLLCLFLGFAAQTVLKTRASKSDIAQL